ncbi:MAG: transcription elongation factor GreA [Deltaproteobacteria bacterium]|nr:MAG: transcription elongation factor GreA [Deltaproteobacteria bacterium]
MDNTTPITRQGFDKLNQELEQLIKVDREDIKKVIAEARALGDLKENAEYHSAKEKQALLEGRIGTIQGIIANCRIIDVESIKSDKIVFGAMVTLTNENGDTLVYKIVGQQESNIKDGKISYNSPIGKALIGREEGDTILVRAPKGDVEYEIESFTFE